LHPANWGPICAGCAMLRPEAVSRVVMADNGDAQIGDSLYALAARLFPIARSLTGPGVRRSLAILREHVPLSLHEVPSGTRAFDWTVPPEWHVREAYITAPDGSRLADYARCNLHLAGYSDPVRATLSRAELAAHVITAPDTPRAIPYRTLYYTPGWAFCLSHAAWQAAPEGSYQVVIDAERKAGSLSYGELFIPGESDDEVLLSTHVCHPSMANDNCSGMALLAHLGAWLMSVPRRFSFRLLFVPGTIGAIVWLARNPAAAQRVRAGLVLAGLGDAGGPVYKCSRRGDAPIDRAMRHVLRHGAPQAQIVPFSPYGYDERQFGSPGFDLPVGLFQRSPYGAYPEYHTSADDMGFIAPRHLALSFAMVRQAIEVLEQDGQWLNLHPYGEPQLGWRGLYAPSDTPEGRARNMALLWVLNLSDGRHSLLDIAERADLAFARIAEAARLLAAHGLLSPCAAQKAPPSPSSLPAL
jgi:aminopeptidase-like protein